METIDLDSSWTPQNSGKAGSVLVYNKTVGGKVWTLDFNTKTGAGLLTKGLNANPVDVRIAGFAPPAAASAPKVPLASQTSIPAREGGFGGHGGTAPAPSSGPSWKDKEVKLLQNGTPSGKFSGKDLHYGTGMVQPSGEGVVTVRLPVLTKDGKDVGTEVISFSNPGDIKHDYQTNAEYKDLFGGGSPTPKPAGSSPVPDKGSGSGDPGPTGKKTPDQLATAGSGDVVKDAAQKAKDIVYGPDTKPIRGLMTDTTDTSERHKAQNAEDGKSSVSPTPPWGTQIAPDLGGLGGKDITDHGTALATRDSRDGKSGIVQMSDGTYEAINKTTGQVTGAGTWGDSHGGGVGVNGVGNGRPAAAPTPDATDHYVAHNTSVAAPPLSPAEAMELINPPITLPLPTPHDTPAPPMGGLDTTHAIKGTFRAE